MRRIFVQFADMQASGSSGFLLYRVRAVRFSRYEISYVALHTGSVLQFCGICLYLLPFLFISSGYHYNDNPYMIQKLTKLEL